jgi:hypothetical protein
MIHISRFEKARKELRLQIEGWEWHEEGYEPGFWQRKGSPEELLKLLNRNLSAAFHIGESRFAESLVQSGLSGKAASMKMREGVSSALWSRGTAYLIDTLVSGDVELSGSLYGRMVGEVHGKLATVQEITCEGLVARIRDFYAQLVLARMEEVENRQDYMVGEKSLSVIGIIDHIVDQHIGILLTPQDGSELPGGRPLAGKKASAVVAEWTGLFGLFGKRWLKEIDASNISDESVVEEIGNQYPFDDAMDETVRSLLTEAWRNRRGTIPWGAHVDLQIGQYAGVRLFEDAHRIDVVFLARDHINLISVPKREISDCFSGELMSKAAQLSVAHAARGIGDGPFRNTSLMAGDGHLRLVAAALIRDFLIVEDKKSILGGVMPNKRPRGCRVGGDTTPVVVYLPRVRYLPSADSSRRISKDLEHNLRARHMVSAHLRKLPEGHTPAPIQIEIAKFRGVEVPRSFTFVREHESGSSPERQRIYRSRTATEAIFQIVGKSIGRPLEMSPAQFERYCRDWLEARGWEIAWYASGGPDGGVDILALRGSGDHVQKAVVQCKHYSNAVGVEAVRELGSVRILKSADTAILMCSGGVSSKAVIEAEALGIEILDGGDLFRKSA